jgi:hypothetical protein
MSGERLHHLWQATASSNNQMQKTGAGDSYPGDAGLPASDLERSAAEASRGALVG